MYKRELTCNAFNERMVRKLTLQKAKKPSDFTDSNGKQKKKVRAIMLAY
jgi:hypothetical protein